MTGPVLVVGATGNLGRATVTALQERGLGVRAADRDPARVAHVLGPDVFSSVADADTNRIVPHHRVETHLGEVAARVFADPQRHLRGRELPLPQVLVQTVLHVGLRRGDAEQVDPTLERLLGRPPRDLATYVRDHRELWTRDADREVVGG